jgi:hypothetical protein
VASAAGLAPAATLFTCFHVAQCWGLTDATKSNVPTIVPLGIVVHDLLPVHDFLPALAGLAAFCSLSCSSFGLNVPQD